MSAVEGSSDRELIDAARRGETHAFAELFRRHHPYVLALSFRLSGDPDMAEDATQETFIRAWKGLDGFRGDAAWRSWLTRVAIRVVGSLEGTGRHTPFDETRFVQRAREMLPDTRVDLELAIAGLPPRARQALVLHDLIGFSYEEIAEQMSITSGTVASQIHRARRLVREALTA